MSRSPARFDMKNSSSRSAVNVGSSSIAFGSDSAATSTGGANLGGTAAAPSTAPIVPRSSLRVQPNAAAAPASVNTNNPRLTALDCFAIVEP